MPRGVVCRAHVPNPIFLTEVARRAGAHIWLTSGGGGRHPLVSGSWRCRSGSVSVGPCLLFVRLYGRLVRLDTFILDDSSALVSSGSWRCRSGFCFVQSVFAICAALLATSVFGAVLLSSYWFGRLARSRRHDAGVGCGGWFATLLRCLPSVLRLSCVLVCRCSCVAFGACGLCGAVRRALRALRHVLMRSLGGVVVGVGLGGGGGVRFAAFVCAFLSRTRGE